MVGTPGKRSWVNPALPRSLTKPAEILRAGYPEPGQLQALLDRLQKIFDNQYYLVFEAMPNKKAGLQRVKVSTEEPGIEIAAANNVWVPAAE